MENFALITLAGELRREANDIVVRRVIEHQPRGLLLQTRTTRVPAIKFVLDPRAPAVYVSAARPPGEYPAGEFVLVLRKHLVGARLVDVGKPLSERIIEFTFRTTLPARELEQLTLVAELFLNAPNLLLLDSSRNIIAAYKHPSGDERLRDLEPYAYPPRRKVDLAEAARSGGDAAWFDPDAFEGDPKGWLIRNVAGVGPVLAAELVRRRAESGRSLPEVLSGLVESLSKPSRSAWIYSKRPIAVLAEANDLDSLRRAVVSPVSLSSLDHGTSEQTFPGILEATKRLFDLIEERTLLDTEKAPYLRRLRTRKKRIAEHRRRLEERRRRFNQATEARESAQLIVTSGLDLSTRRPEIEVMDYSNGSGRPRTIVLDPALTIRENAARMFHAHRKAERGLRLLDRQTDDADAAERAIRTEERRIAAIGDWNAWHAFLDSEPRNGTPKVGKSRGERAKKSPKTPSRYGRSLTFQGREIFVGRNSRENDALTFEVASPDDFWLHAADYSGSHVIVRNPTRAEDIPDDVLIRAAELAAYHSQARNSPKVHVHYTRRKFVRKPRRARPGLVLLEKFKTITVVPCDWTASETGEKA